MKKIILIITLLSVSYFFAKEATESTPETFIQFWFAVMSFLSGFAILIIAIETK